jgi:hypothetical protein
MQTLPVPRSSPRSRRARSIWIAISCLTLFVLLTWWRWDRIGPTVHDRLHASAWSLCLIAVPVPLYVTAIVLERLQRVAVFRRSTPPVLVPSLRPHFLPGKIAIVVACALGLASSWILIRDDEGGFGDMFFLTCTLIAFVLVPFVALAALRFGLRWFERASSRSSRMAFVSRSLMLVFICGIAHLPRSCIHQREMQGDAERARSWCLTIVPRLDAWRDAHGSYPEHLVELGDDAQPPTLIHGEVGYHTSKDSSWFAFDVPDPDECIFPFGWEFPSDARRWEYYN